MDVLTHGVLLCDYEDPTYALSRYFRCNVTCCLPPRDVDPTYRVCSMYIMMRQYTVEMSVCVYV